MKTLRKRFGILAKSMTCDEIERVFESVGYGDKELGDLNEEEVWELFMWILDQDVIEGEKVTDEFRLEIYDTLLERLGELIVEGKKMAADWENRYANG